eukprot:11208949-Lingulodinium_polyedra.AAC.1
MGRPTTSVRRLLRKGRKRALRIVVAEGRLRTAGRDIKCELQNSRRHIWATRPEASDAADPTLEHYFQG